VKRRGRLRARRRWRLGTLLPQIGSGCCPFTGIRFFPLCMKAEKETKPGKTASFLALGALGLVWAVILYQFFFR
jgi:hypothetical protein